MAKVLNYCPTCMHANLCLDEEEHDEQWKRRDKRVSDFVSKTIVHCRGVRLARNDSYLTPRSISTIVRSSEVN